MKTNDDFYDENYDESILSQAQKNIYAWYTYFGQNYEAGRQNKQFALLSQWSNVEEQELKRLNIPRLQFNKLYDSCKKVISESRRMTPQIEIRSKKYVSSENDAENLKLQRTLNIMQNLVRSLSYNSQAKYAYEIAFTNAIYCGMGAIHVRYDYEDSESFNAMPIITQVPKPELAFFDPSAIEPCKNDGEFCGVYYTIDRKLFAKLYPEIDYPSSYPAQIPQYFTWDTLDTITIVDYYCKKWFKKELVLLENGDTLEKSDYDKFVEELTNNNMPIPDVVKKRKADDYKIMHYKMIKGTILESSIYPGKELPVVFVDGDSFYFNNIQRTQSFIKHAIDAQRFLNYTGVAIAQGLKNSRKETFLATPEQVKGFESVWQNPEVYQGALLYNFDPKAGKPDKIPPSEISQSLYQNYERANNDIQSILGVYNANLGAPTNEISGVAINAKKQSGNFASGVFKDNLLRAVEQVGRLIVKMIPEVFDAERTVSLLNADGSSSSIIINQRMPDGTIENDITGNYFDVAIEAGASYEDQKMGALELLLKLSQVNPQILPMIADLIADNMDINNRPQLVSRLRNLVPPQILAKETGQPLPPQNQQPNPAEMAQMQSMQLKQNEQQLNAKKLEIEQNELALREKEAEYNKKRFEVESQHTITDQKLKEMQLLAEIYRTGVESKTGEREMLEKMLNLHNS